MPDDVDRPHLAFRTITTMLSHISSGDYHDVVRSLPPPDGDLRHELKLLTSFSVLLVRQHEVVAVMAKKHPAKPNHIKAVISPHMDLDCKEKNNNSDVVLEPTSDEVWLVDITQGSWTVPAELEGDDEGLCVRYLEHSWGNEAFATHVWILTRLLLLSKSVPTYLLIYIIASSFRKISRRVNYSHLSTPFFESLTSLKDETFQFDESLVPRGKAKTKFDPLLAQSLSKLMTKGMLEAPNLISCLAGGKDYYTKDTYMEFHGVLIKLLCTFKAALDDITGIVSDTNRDSPNCIEVLTNALNISMALLYISKCSAIDVHLQIVERKLKGLRKETQVTDGSADPDPDIREELIGVGFDELPAAPDEQPPLWKSYSNWLKLLVIHFDVALYLINFVRTAQFETISTSILVPPRINKTMLSWEEYLSDQKFFSILSYDALRRNAYNPTTEQIISYIRIFTDLLPILNQYYSMDKAPTKKMKFKDNLIKDLNVLNLSEANDIISKLEQLDSDCDISACKGVIAGSLECFQMMSGYNLLKNLPPTEDLKAKGILRRQVKNWEFNGTMHCEASLAGFKFCSDRSESLDSSYAEITTEFRSVGQLIGVSKPCCPVCYALVTKYLHSQEQAFGRGTHGIISACTLPTWLPDRVIDDMILHFGEILREELRDIMLPSQLLPTRAQSSSSAALSEREIGDLKGITNDVVDPGVLRGFSSWQTKRK